MKLEEIPHKLIQTTTRAQLRDSPSESAHVSIHTYCIFFPLNTLLHCFPSLWKFFSAKSKARALVTDHWPSRQDLAFSPPWPSLSLAGNPSPASDQHRLRPPEIFTSQSDQTTSNQQIYYTTNYQAQLDPLNNPPSPNPLSPPILQATSECIPSSPSIS